MDTKTAILARTSGFSKEETERGREREKKKWAELPYTGYRCIDCAIIIFLS